MVGGAVGNQGGRGTEQSDPLRKRGEIKNSFSLGFALPSLSLPLPAWRSEEEQAFGRVVCVLVVFV